VADFYQMEYKTMRESLCFFKAEQYPCIERKFWRYMEIVNFSTQKSLKITQLMCRKSGKKQELINEHLYRTYVKDVLCVGRFCVFVTAKIHLIFKFK